MHQLKSAARPLFLCTALVSLAACQAAGPPSEDRVHAQRPFISRDTHTTEEKVVSAELGASIWANHQTEVPVLLKYGLGPKTEFFLGTSPYLKVEENDLGPTGTGWGDTNIGMRHRLRDADMYAPAYAFQINTKLPTGRPKDGLGTGATDWFGALMAYQSYYGFRTTGFYQLGILGESEEVGRPDSNHEHTFAVQTRKDVDSSITAFGELALVWEPEIDREEATILAGASFSLDSLTAVDVGVRLGIGNDAPSFQVEIGIARALGMVFFPEPDRRAVIRN
jgi:hypothetical protein